MIYEPSSDISQEEAELLSNYTKNGGHVLVMAGPTEDGVLENCTACWPEYGVETYDGIVVEGDREHYTVQPYICCRTCRAAISRIP